MYLLPGTLLTIKGSVRGSKGRWDRRNWEERSGCNGQLLDWVWCVSVFGGGGGEREEGLQGQVVNHLQKVSWKILLKN